MLYRRDSNHLKPTLISCISSSCVGSILSTTYEYKQDFLKEGIVLAPSLK